MELPPITLELLEIAAASWALGILVLYSWKRTSKAWLLYAHLTFLFLPLFVYAARLPCAQPILDGLQAFCAVTLTKVAIYLIPPTILIATLAGYWLFPYLYVRQLRCKEQSSHLISTYATKIGKPLRLFWFDNAQPLAFSLRNTIFMSQGMFELLNHHEREAVLLHELGHIRERSGWKKFSSALTRLFSPLASFSCRETVQQEERRADLFAAQTQGTTKYLKQAKEKVILYYSSASRARLRI